MRFEVGALQHRIKKQASNRAVSLACPVAKQALRTAWNKLFYALRDGQEPASLVGAFHGGTLAPVPGWCPPVFYCGFLWTGQRVWFTASVRHSFNLLDVELVGEGEPPAIELIGVASHTSMGGPVAL